MIQNKSSGKPAQDDSQTVLAWKAQHEATPWLCPAWIDSREWYAQRNIENEGASVEWMNQLPRIVSNALKADGLYQQEEVARYIREGKIRPGVIFNLGPLGFKQVCDCLGITPPPIAKPPVRVASERTIAAAIAMLERNGYTVSRNMDH